MENENFIENANRRNQQERIECKRENGNNLTAIEGDEVIEIERHRQNETQIETENENLREKWKQERQVSWNETRMTKRDTDGNRKWELERKWKKIGKDTRKEQNVIQK